jgi:hypothetical protein
MPADNELETWRREWQAESFAPLDLRGRVERDIRRRRLSFAASVAVTILIGGGTTLWATVSGESEVMVLLAAVWAFIVITWVTSIQLDRRRGPSKPIADTTAAFLDFSILSCRARHQGITASAALCAGFFVFMLAWKYRELSEEMPLEVWTYLTSGRVITLGAITAALAVLALYQRRRLGRELRNLVILRQWLEPGASGGG